MLVLSVLIYFYRVLGGSNEWLRTHGIILVTYYALGGIAYDELEGWTLLDTTYFLTVTVTTVGYGDMCPETPEGKLFTVVYALLGLVFVFAALSPLLDALIFIKDLLLKPCTPKDPTELDDDGDLSIEDLRKGGNWEFKYFSALMGPIIVFVIGLVIGFTVLRLDVSRLRSHALHPPPAHCRLSGWTRGQGAGGIGAAPGGRIHVQDPMCRIPCAGSHVQDACAGSHVQDACAGCMCRMHVQDPMCRIPCAGCIELVGQPLPTTLTPATQPHPPSRPSMASTGR